MPRRFDLTPTNAFWSFVGLLMLCGLYFTTQVVRHQSARREAPTRAPLRAGEPIELVTVIDGDEVTVKRGDEAFVLRLLGVKCPLGDGDGALAVHGRTCRQALKGALAPGTLTLGFDGDAAAIDRHGRVLAYISAAGIDVGEALVSRGALVVYTAYPFGREAAYLEAEAEARARGRGLWADAQAADTVDALRLSWTAQRAD